MRIISAEMFGRELGGGVRAQASAEAPDPPKTAPSARGHKPRNLKPGETGPPAGARGLEKVVGAADVRFDDRRADFARRVGLRRRAAM